MCPMLVTRKVQLKKVKKVKNGQNCKKRSTMVPKKIPGQSVYDFFHRENSRGNTLSSNNSYVPCKFFFRR
jgi:hypothetical protein